MFIIYSNSLKVFVNILNIFLLIKAFVDNMYYMIRINKIHMIRSVI